MSGYYVDDPTVGYWPVLRSIPECRDSLGSRLITERDDRHAPTLRWVDDRLDAPPEAARPHCGSNDAPSSATNPRRRTQRPFILPANAGV